MTLQPVLGSRTMCLGPRFLALMMAGVLSAASPAFAVEPTPVPLAQSLTGPAKSEYDAGRLLFEDGDNAGALAKFKHAFELSNDPRLLWNMAVCEKELRHYALAAGLVGRYLRVASGRLTAEQRESAAETRKALRGFYSSVYLDGAPDGATVLVDGVEAGKTPLLDALPLDLGSRVLRLERAGFEPFEVKLDIPGATEVTVPITMKRLADAGTPTGAVLPPGAAPKLSVTSAGARDVVTVDGKVVGSQHWEGSLSAGEHTVRVTAPGKKAYETRVNLSVGGSRSLDITLEDEAHHNNTWLWVAGGGVLAIGAGVGAYFLLKPEDKAGAHPTGKFATVYLPASWGQ